MQPLFPHTALYGAQLPTGTLPLDWRMQYVNSLLDLIGNTPLLRLSPSLGATSRAATTGPAGARQGGVPQPRRLGEGPHRHADDRGGRGLGRAPAGRHDRRADLGQHRRRAGDGRPGARATGASSSAPTRSARTSATCSRRTAPRWSSARPRSPPSTPTPTTTSPTGWPPQPGAWKPDQYSNPHNPRSHYETTGPEIWEQTEGRITHFVAGVGTGGTISGVGRYLKEQNPDVQVIGADPAGSVYSGGTGRPYLVEGVGEDFWPETYDRDVADRIIEVSDADSFAFTRRLAREEALLVGGSSGMAAYAAKQLADELAGTPEGEDAVIVVLLPDSGRGYLTKVFNDDWLAPVRLPGRRGAERPARPSARCCAARTGGCPTWCTPTPAETIAEAVHILQEYGVSQMPVVRAEPPIVAAEVAGSVSERTLLDALFAGRARLTDPVEDHMSPPLPTIGSDRAGRGRGRAARGRRRRARPGGRQAGCGDQVPPAASWSVLTARRPRPRP